jgi:Zn-finger nucleic acid-binding protein
MATCPNCKKTLSCGCQKRKALDGTDVCTNCIGTYQNKGVTNKASNIVYKAPPLPPTEWTAEQLENAIGTWNNFKKKING